MVLKLVSAPDLRVVAETKVGWALGQHPIPFATGTRGSRWWIATTRTEPVLAAMTTDGGRLASVIFASGETVGKRGLEAIDASGQTIWAQDIALAGVAKRQD